MSHQDKDGRNSSAFNFQALSKALRWLLKGADLSDISFRSDCTWSAIGFIFTALLWSWSDEKGLKHRFFKARKICLKALGEAALGQGAGGKPAQSYQAFTKRLRTWTTTMVSALAVILRARMQEALPDRMTVEGYTLFAVDGSRLELPRTESNEEHFSARSARKSKKRRAPGPKKRKGRKRHRAASRQARAKQSRQKKANCPLMWLTILWHMGTGLPWDWRTGPSDSSERHHWRRMITSLPRNALCAADAGYVGYEVWKEMKESGREFLVRVGGNVRLLRKLGYAREKNGIVYLWPDSAAAKRLPPLVLRLIIVRDGRQPWFLVTSVLDKRKLSDKQVATIYRRRWGIEICHLDYRSSIELYLERLAA